MRKILGFGGVLTAACLTGTLGAAYAQSGGPATVGGRIGTTTSSSLVTAPNNLEQKANEQAAANGTPAANTAVPGVNTAAPAGEATLPNANTGAGINTAVPGSVTTPAGTAGLGANTAAPTNYQGPATRGTAPGQPGNVYPATGNRATGALNNMPNQAGAPAGTYPNNPQGAANGGQTFTPGLANPGEWNYRSNSSNTYANRAEQGIYPGPATGATPGYTSRVMPGMGGYNGVNPMGTTMAPGYYYAGTAGMPYATYNSQGTNGGGMPYQYGATTAYPRSYITPGYNGTQIQGYTYQRRGLFGRRNRIVYPANSPGNAYGSYSASPNGYSTYGAAPSGYNTAYGTTTYYSSPGSYSYGTYPY